MAIVPQTPAWAAQLYRYAKKGADARSISFTLTRPEFDALVFRANGACMMTGIPFEFRRYSGSTRRPFAPSLDRIDSSKGYSANNVRLVCILVNLALNEWGAVPLLRVAQALVARSVNEEAQAKVKAQYAEPNYITVRAYLHRQAIAATPQQKRSIAAAARTFCKRNNIPLVIIEEARPYVRANDTLQTEPSTAYPENVVAASVAAVLKSR